MRQLNKTICQCEYADLAVTVVIYDVFPNTAYLISRAGVAVSDRGGLSGRVEARCSSDAIIVLNVARMREVACSGKLSKRPRGFDDLSAIGAG